MWMIATIPFVLQAVVIAIDEWVFHLRRGLPLWERIGHPLDTLSILLCMLYVLFVPFNPFSLKVYIGLAIFSSLFVTKDEFVHKHHCPWSENWLHALLFLLHPITLACAGFIWPVVQGSPVAPWISEWLDDPQSLRQFLVLQAGAMTLFFLYQIVYWNIVWKEKRL